MSPPSEHPDPDLFSLQAEQSWKKRLADGVTRAGNLELNLQFLEKTGLLTLNRNILELGGGIGTLSHELAQKGLDIVATDISSEAVEYGRRQYPSLRLEVMSAEELSFPDAGFDIVLSFDVFEHLPRIDRHLEEVRRVLRPGGWYLFQTPNKYSNALYETLKTRSFRWKRYHPSLHTPGQLRRRLIRCGFAVRFVKMNTMNDFSLGKLGRIGIPAAMARCINTQRLPLAFQTNLYLIAQKLPR